MLQKARTRENAENTGVFGPLFLMIEGWGYIFTHLPEVIAEGRKRTFVVIVHNAQKTPAK